jgi:ABC-type Fe3+-hydroxamate transport system substrate-binding protein
MRTLIAVVACLALAARGSEERPQSSAVTIENKLGDVTIGERPVRVVALDFPSADDAIALGVVPAGTMFRRLDGAWIPLDLPPATSMAFPSLLSIPYALDELVPRLAEAVG